jgi:hypothetical protein
MLKFWKRNQPRRQSRDDDLLLYMPDFYPADNTLEAHLRYMDLAFHQAVETRDKARRKRFTVVGR